MTEVAHMGQEECENTSSSRLYHFVSIISYPGWIPVTLAAIPVMWATPEWRIGGQPATELVRLPQRLTHSCSSAAAFLRT